VNQGGGARKIFGIGLSRTATKSLNSALAKLGYRSLHWPHDPITQDELMRYFAGKKPFALTVAEEYDAITDTPAALLFRELSAVYPESRFILTLRNRCDWLDSCESFFSGPRTGDAAYEAYCDAIRMRLYGRTCFNRGDFGRSYDTHVESVRGWFRAVPAKLLEIDISAGDAWGRLCEFLACPVPDAPFPHENRFYFPHGREFL
jgi:hypothetical protein